jgi:hypothetical protein
VVEEEEIEGDLSLKVVVEEEKIKRDMSPRAVKEEVIEIPASVPSSLPWMHHPPSNLTKIHQKDDARERSSSISTLRNLSAPMPATSSGIAFDQGPVDAMRSKKCGSDFVTRSDEDGEDAAEDRARGSRALIDVKSENPWLEEVPTFCPNVILEVRVKKKFAKERQEAVSGGGADDNDAAKRKELLLVHGKQQLQQHQHQHVCDTSTFREWLDAKLSEPFDGKELETLLGIASHRKPMYRARETRNSSVQVISNQEGNSYLDYYPGTYTHIIWFFFNSFRHRSPVKAYMHWIAPF